MLLDANVLGDENFESREPASGGNAVRVTGEQPGTDSGQPARGGVIADDNNIEQNAPLGNAPKVSTSQVSVNKAGDGAVAIVFDPSAIGLLGSHKKQGCYSKH